MKRKININREKISSEEIAKKRDFGSLMKSYTAVKKPFWKHWSFITGSATVLVAVVATVVYFQLNQPKNPGSDTRVEPNNSTTAGDFTYDHSKKDLGHAPFINPPLKGVDVPFTEYEVESGKTSELKYKTGSTIKIPQDAFADASGNKISGKVQVQYREFHDPVDFFVSGIPMTYDSSGMHYTFESAGMVEIYAFQDGKKLKINHDKRLEVQMATRQDGPGFNVYSLDTTAKNWVYIGKDQLKKEKHDELYVKNDGKQNILEQMKQREEKTEQEEQDHSVQLQGEIKTVQQEIKKMEDTKPVEPRKVNRQKKTFDLDINPKEFPEFSAYQKVIFEVGDENKDFKDDVYKIVWEDITLSEGTVKGSYMITLTKGNDKRKLIAYPVFEGKNYDVVEKEFRQKFSDYSSQLKVKQDLEKKKQADYDALLQQIQQQRVEYEKQVKEVQRKQEEMLKKEMESMQTGAKVFRVFSVNGFGVYNCDSPQMYPKGAEVSALLRDESGNTLASGYNVYLVDRQKNALFTYFGNPCDKLQFNPSSKNVLWTVTLQQELAVLFDEQFAGVKKTYGDVTVNMKTFPKDEISSVEKIKSLLGISDELGSK